MGLKRFFRNVRNAGKKVAKAVTDPKIIATVALAYATGGLTWSASAGFGFSTSAAMTSALTTGALSVVSHALTAGANDQRGQDASDLGDRGANFQFRSPTATREIVYGTVRKSGVILNMMTTGTTHTNYVYTDDGGTRVLHMLVALSAAPIHSFTKVFLNDTQIFTGGVGNLSMTAAASGTTPDYSSKVRFKLSRGSNANHNYVGVPVEADSVGFPDQTASSDQYAGIAYIYLQMTYDATLFEKGIPKVTVEMRGIPTEPVNQTFTLSDGSTIDVENRFLSSNPAHAIRDYLLNKEYGLGVDPDEIDESSITAAASVCDNDPEVYSCNGVVSLAKTPRVILQDLLSSCAGILTYRNGQFRLLAGEYRTPTQTITYDDIVSGISISPKNPAREQFNSITAVYFNGANNEVSDTVVQESAPIIARDNGERKVIEATLPFTNSPNLAIRLARIQLFKMRREMTLQLETNLKHFDLDVGDNVYVTLSRYGFNQKIFEVVAWSFSGIDGSEPRVSLSLRETSSDIYADPPTDSTAKEVEIIYQGQITLPRIGTSSIGVAEVFGGTTNSRWTSNTDKELIITSRVVAGNSITNEIPTDTLPITGHVWFTAYGTSGFSYYKPSLTSEDASIMPLHSNKPGPVFTPRLFYIAVDSVGSDANITIKNYGELYGAVGVGGGYGGYETEYYSGTSVSDPVSKSPRFDYFGNALNGGNIFELALDTLITATRYTPHAKANDVRIINYGTIKAGGGGGTAGSSWAAITDNSTGDIYISMGGKGGDGRGYDHRNLADSATTFDGSASHRTTDLYLVGNAQSSYTDRVVVRAGGTGGDGGDWGEDGERGAGPSVNSEVGSNTTGYTKDNTWRRESYGIYRGRGGRIVLGSRINTQFINYGTAEGQLEEAMGGDREFFLGYGHFGT